MRFHNFLTIHTHARTHMRGPRVAGPATYAACVHLLARFDRVLSLRNVKNIIIKVNWKINSGRWRACYTAREDGFFLIESYRLVEDRLSVVESFFLFFFTRGDGILRHITIPLLCTITVDENRSWYFSLLICVGNFHKDWNNARSSNRKDILASLFATNFISTTVIV